MPPAPIKSLTAEGNPADSFVMVVVVALIVADAPPRCWMRVSKPNAVGIFSFWRDARVRRETVKVGEAVIDLVVAVALLNMANRSNGRRIIVCRWWWSSIASNTGELDSRCRCWGDGSLRKIRCILARQKWSSTRLIPWERWWAAKKFTVLYDATTSRSWPMILPDPHRAIDQPTLSRHGNRNRRRQRIYA